MSESNGGWVFISHSHQDIALVRRIRNHLESIGMEPLMFYLKCLSDEDEIEELIKREIDEREWFIYADSPKARSSKWVQTEREYIETLEGKKIFTIDLNTSLESQLRQLNHIARQMKVFISYSHRDAALYQRLKERFITRDMLVLSDEDIQPGSNIQDAVLSNLKEACRDGFVVILITEHSSHSAYIRQEIAKAAAAKGKIVPVFVGGATLHKNLFPLIGDLQGYEIGLEPTDNELDKFIGDMLHRVEYYQSDFRNLCGYRSAKIIHLPAISIIDNLTFWDCSNLECVYIPDTVIDITADAFANHPNILVKCSAGSYAEKYCKKHGIRHELLDP